MRTRTTCRWSQVPKCPRAQIMTGLADNPLAQYFPAMRPREAAASTQAGRRATLSMRSEHQWPARRAGLQHAHGKHTDRQSARWMATAHRSIATRSTRQHARGRLERLRLVWHHRARWRQLHSTYAAARSTARSRSHAACATAASTNASRTKSARSAATPCPTARSAAHATTRWQLRLSSTLDGTARSRGSSSLGGVAHVGGPRLDRALDGISRDGA